MWLSHAHRAGDHLPPGLKSPLGWGDFDFAWARFWHISSPRNNYADKNMMNASLLNFNFDEPIAGSNSTLRINSKGRQYLQVFYDPETDDFDEAITRAKIYHGIENKPMVVLAIPKKMEELKMETKQRKDYSERLYKFYLEKIGPLRKTKSKAIKNILTHSRKYDFKDMAKAVNNYKPEAMARDKEYRKDPANFFDTTGEPYFRDYLPGVFVPKRLSVYSDTDYRPHPEILTTERLRELNS